MTGDEGALAISEVVKHSPLLEDFRCSSTRVDSGGIALSNALETCSHLKKLDLRDNVFGAEAGVGLSKSLFKLANLVGLYLSYLNLEDEGAIAIANALKESAPSLEVLEMAGNNITGDAAPALAACIASKQHLTKLNLSENELKGEGATQIGKALEGLAQLKEVDMSNNSMRRAGARQRNIQEIPDILGPLDENDPEGGDENDPEGGDDGEESGEGQGEGVANGDDLESKLKNLEVSQDD
ncbi:hypothetical protein SLE2022_171510 [Rubroshorea leprosula]